MSPLVELMGETLERAFVEEARGGLFGAGPSRALDAYETYLAKGSAPSLIVEAPLLGAPDYDVLVGSYGRALRQASTPTGCDGSCADAFAWARGMRPTHGVDLFFECDHVEGAGKLAGIHCRHEGDVEVAGAFFEAIGQGWRAPAYARVAGRLPEGWDARFCAAFVGRPSAPTRLELTLARAQRLRIARDRPYLGSCLEHIGFQAFDEGMLDDIRCLVAQAGAATVQLDILSDGTVGPTLSVTSCLERTGTDFGSLFREGGAIAAVCGAYERMGASDGRWRLARRCLFAKRRGATSGRARQAVTLSIPNCGKAKWTDGRRQAAKLYILVAVVPDANLPGRDV